MNNIIKESQEYLRDCDVKIDVCIVVRKANKEIETIEHLDLDSLLLTYREKETGKISSRATGDAEGIEEIASIQEEVTARHMHDLMEARRENSEPLPKREPSLVTIKNPTDTACYVQLFDRKMKPGDAPIKSVEVPPHFEGTIEL